MTVAISQKDQVLTPSVAAQKGYPDVRTEIDNVTRPVVLGLFSTAIIWLIVASILMCITALKLQFPTFLNFSFLSYGRVAPAAEGVFLLGWCSLAGMGVGLWIVMRQSARCSTGVGMAYLGVGLWNLGVLVGLVATLVGQVRPFAGLEFPFASTVLIFAGFSFVAFWLFLSFDGGAKRTPIASMFVLGAICWFVWSFLTGNLLLSSNRFTGAMEHIVSAWTSYGLVWLWLAPLAFGVAYYLVPKVTGLPIFSGPVARVSFWLFFILGGLTSTVQISGGPVPLWLTSVGSAASILLLVPIGAIIYNLYASARDSARLGVSPSASFVRFGLIVALVAAALAALGSLRSVDHIVHSTLFHVGVQSLVLQGFVSMVIFGAIYYIMPRLSGCEWISSSLISVHFLGASYGVAMGCVMLLLSGVFSGIDLADANSLFSQVLQSSAFFYWGRTMSFGLLFVGYASFIVHFLLMVLRIGQPEGEATLMRGAQGH
jgi:cytochrome c oxidase cbb3-type subunit 1